MQSSARERLGTMSADLALKQPLASITQRIVNTYGECGAIHHLGHCPLPSYREVVDILGDLREILYPGYGRRQDLNRAINSPGICCDRRVESATDGASLFEPKERELMVLNSTKQEKPTADNGDGLLDSSSRDDKTPLELLVSGVASWPRVLVLAVESLMANLAA